MRKLIFVLMVAGLFFSACMAGGQGSARQPTKPPPPLKPEVDFARDTFMQLVKGDPAVEDMLDWETLRSFNSDAGSAYSLMPGEAAKAAFRKSFIQGFSEPYRSSGDIPYWLKGISNWRIESKEATKAIVIADHPSGKTLEFTVLLKDGRQKLSSITGR